MVVGTLEALRLQVGEKGRDTAMIHTLTIYFDTHTDHILQTCKTLTIVSWVVVVGTLKALRLQVGEKGWDTASIHTLTIYFNTHTDHILQYTH